ncbi:MAG TPA: hotdog domain-containing protein [Oligoflexia bacterium]|nr:hotdog domain-containing protein [Oligoflexia bacterium]
MSFSDRFLAIRSVMMPRDTNHLGSIFGGHILSLIDMAAGQHARGVSPKKYVTKVMREVEFIAPIFVGDSVSFYTSTVRIGKTSITIKVDVEALRGVNHIETIKVTSAEVIMVAVNSKGKPIKIISQKK